MSEPMDRREVFEPEKVATYTHSVFGGYAPFVSLEDYQRLLAANREKDAEIERLKKHDDAVYGSALHYLNQLTIAIAELTSLRASGGEKPEDAWRRAWSVGYFDALNNVDVLRPGPYVAPPALTREKE